MIDDALVEEVESNVAEHKAGVKSISARYADQPRPSELAYFDITLLEGTRFEVKLSNAGFEVRFFFVFRYPHHLQGYPPGAERHRGCRDFREFTEPA